MASSDKARFEDAEGNFLRCINVQGWTLSELLAWIQEAQARYGKDAELDQVENEIRVIPSDR